MNWRRGFFRLWLVVSALWLGLFVIGMIAAGPIERYRTWKHDRETLAKLEAGVECGPWLKHMAQGPSESTPPEGAVLGVTEEECDQWRLEAKARVESSIYTNEFTAALATLVAIVPPLALLVIGFFGAKSAGWVARGFRRS